MIKTIKKANEMAQRNKGYFVCWSGVVFDLKNRFVRADKVFLNVVYCHPKEGPVFRRLAPVINRRRGNKTDAHLRYSLSANYRVTDGSRAGHVVAEADLREGETFRRTGLYKNLRCGSEAWLFSEGRKGDRNAADVLEGIGEFDRDVRSLEQWLPEFFLTIPRNRRAPRVRDTLGALEYLKGFLGYGPESTLEYNADSLREHIVVDAGNDRDAFPYEFFFGAGVVAASAERFGEWAHVPSLGHTTSKDYDMNTTQPEVRSMTLRQWLHDKKISAENALAISVATDGFKHGRDNLLSVSLTAGYPDSDKGTVYVEGGSMLAVQEHTGVSQGIYAEHAMPIEEAIEEIKDVVDEASFLVLYRAKYTHEWLMDAMPDLVGAKPLSKLVKHRMMLPADLSTIEGLQHRIEQAVAHVTGKGYSFDDLCTEFTPGYDGDTADAYITGSTPKLERQVYRLYALWTTLLDTGE